MLPPLLGLLLDCAKKTDQSVISISLGALVHLIEVEGHQFSDNDWDTLLKGIRDASYTTQPVELLNYLGFDSSKNNIGGPLRDSEVNVRETPSPRSVGTPNNRQFDSDGQASLRSDHDQNSEESSPSGRGVKQVAEGRELQHAQT